MSDRQRNPNPIWLVVGGAVIGGVEVVVAVSLAALVFSGYLVYYVSAGVGMFLAAAVVALAVLAILAGKRGVVGGVHEAVAAVLAFVASEAALHAFGSTDRAFSTAVAAIAMATLLCGVTFVVLGVSRRANLIRFVPLPVVGGFLAGMGWLMFKGGLQVAAGAPFTIRTLKDLIDPLQLERWAPALVFGVAMLVVVRVSKRPIAIPLMIVVGVALFVIGTVATGHTFQDARDGGWLLGSFGTGRLWHAWAYRSISVADWSAVLGAVPAIATAMFVALIACLFTVSGLELAMDTNLDPNQELRDAGVPNLIAGPFGGMPGFHALSLSSLAGQMNIDARAAGLIGALVPLGAMFFGARVLESIPKALVGGVLVFLGSSFLIEWLWDQRRVLPVGEYLVVWGILLTISARGILPGVLVGIVLAMILFAVNYGRTELTHEVSFGRAYTSNVDRPAAERAALATMADRVQILRVNGFVFFGAANGLLDRIRERVRAGGGLRFVVIDLRRTTGMDSSGVLSFHKAAEVAEAHGCELVFTGGSDRVRAQLARGGVMPSDTVRFEPDLDRGLQRCEDVLLAEPSGALVPAAAGQGSADALAAMPERLRPYLERLELTEGDQLIGQGQPPEDVFVLESGRLRIEMVTPAGTRIRVRSIHAGVIVGEIALYTGAPRSADVVAETPAAVLKLSRQAIDAIATTDPALASAMHRWFASILAERLTDTNRALEALGG